MNRQHTIKFCLKAALGLDETPWSVGMASALDRDELHLLSAAAVVATLMKKKEEYELRTGF